MELLYRELTIDDLDLLVSSRVEVLQAVSDGYSIDLPEGIEATTKEYYKEAIGKTHTAYGVFDNSNLVACGGICYTKTIPTVEVNSGKEAHIVNMYTKPEWRSKGIAYKMLNMLVECAKNSGVDRITLEATPMGKGLYEKFGFMYSEEAMILPVDILENN